MHPRTDVNELRSRRSRRSGSVAEGTIIITAAARFQPGDRVRVTAGPLTGLPGLVSTLRPHQRIELLLQLLGSPQLAHRHVYDFKVTARET